MPRQAGLTRRGLLALATSTCLPAPVLAVTAEAAIRATDLRCEYLTEPQGLDITAPRLSWRCIPARAGLSGLRQTAYQICAASTLAGLGGQPDLWDSGVVAAAQSCHIRYAGKPLTSRQRIYWSVRIWDQDGQADAPVTSRWSMGLLDAADWQADWIGLDTPPPPETLQAEWFWADEGRPLDAIAPGRRYFRRVFDLPRAVAAAELTAFAAADDYARVAVDGALIGEVYGWTPATVLRMPALPAGRHVLEIAADALGQSPHPAGVAVSLDGLFTAAAGWLSADRPDAEARDWRPVMRWGPTGMAPWGPLALHRPRPLPARWLRRRFTLAAPPLAASLSFSGLGWSELFINGKPASDARLSPPLTDYDLCVTTVTYDVATLLSAGENVLGVVLGGGRFVAPRPTLRDFGWPKLLLRLDIDLADGSRATITSDAAWKLSLDGAIRDANEFDGEIIDTRMDLHGWAEPGFDDTAWRAADIVTPPSGALRAMRQPPSRITQILSPVAITDGGADGWIFDFGQNIAGVCQLTTSGAAGDVVTVRHAEWLRPDGRLNTANLRTALARDRITLAGTGPRPITPRFTSHGFRYAGVTGLGAAKPPPQTLTALVISDDLRRSGRFTCADPRLTRIHDAAVWSARNNCRSIRTDCPQRDERQGWLGDPAEEARGEAYLFDNAAFYAKVLDDIIGTQRPDGALADIAPAYWRLYSDDVSWPAMLAIIPGILHDHYGDLDVLARSYPPLTRWLDRIWEKSGDTFGDWGAPGMPRARPDPLIAAAYRIHCFSRAGDYAGRLGLAAEAAQHKLREAALRGMFQLAFHHPATGLYGGGDATSCIITLAFGLAAPETVAPLQARLVALIDQHEEPRACFGLIGAQWVNRVLQQAGRGDLAYRMTIARGKPSLGYMIDQGATTLWELWDGDTADPTMSSLDHTMLTGDLLVWIYQDLCGIQPDPAAPGFARAVIAPKPVPDLAWAAASYQAITGLIESRWERQGERITYEIALPPNVEATISLPGTAPFTVAPGSHRFSGAG